MKEIELFRDIIHIAGNTFTLERVKNIDDLVDNISDELFNEDERLPYWAELWPSAMALSEYILQNPDKFKNKYVLELGCGLGLTTLALARVSPKELMATDYEQSALERTGKNFNINKTAIHPVLKLLDWRKPELDRKYDVIIASDIAYEERFFQPLINLFKQYLSEKGHIILAEPNRKIARIFFGKLALSNFNFVNTDKYIKQGGQSIKVSIYNIYY